MSNNRVLITGASAGLGERFAEAFARRGESVILVARRADRLATLAKRLHEEFGVEASYHSTDLTEPGAIAQLMVDIETDGHFASKLVNNAGFGLRGRFEEIDGPSQARMIDLNCRAVMELSHAVIPHMLSLKGGGILNVASTASFQPGPWMTVYYASKAFVLSFSEGLHYEMRDKGISVSALCPGPTQTEFFAKADMQDSMLNRYLAGDPDKVVADGLRALDRNNAVKVSGVLNAALASSIRATPRPLARSLAANLQKDRRAPATAN